MPWKTRQQLLFSPLVLKDKRLLLGFFCSLGSAGSLGPPAAGAEAWASIPGIARVDPGAASHAFPVPALCVSVNGATCRLLAYGADLILLVSVLVHSHSKAPICNIQKQTGLFLKLPALKCVECDSVCVADKILQIGHLILCFLWAYLKYALPSLSVLVPMFPAVFYRGCLQLQQVKWAQQPWLEGLCLQCLI